MKKAIVLEGSSTKRKFRLLPAYGWLPIFSVVATHLVVYYGTKLINSGWRHHDLTVGADGAIPLAPEWTLIYVLTFLFWAGGLVFAAWQEEELCCKLCTGVIVGYAMCAVMFLVLPTSIARPEVTGTAYYDDLLRATYGADIPSNLFPSMHCMMSYMIFRALTVSPGIKRPYRIAAGVLVVLICASTLYIKQHYFVDTVAGIVFGEAAFLIGMRSRLWTHMQRLNKKLLRGRA